LKIKKTLKRARRTLSNVSLPTIKSWLGKHPFTKSLTPTDKTYPRNPAFKNFKKRPTVLAKKSNSKNQEYPHSL